MHPRKTREYISQNVIKISKDEENKIKYNGYNTLLKIYIYLKSSIQNFITSILEYSNIEISFNILKQFMYL